MRALLDIVIATEQNTQSYALHALRDAMAYMNGIQQVRPLWRGDNQRARCGAPYGLP